MTSLSPTDPVRLQLPPLAHAGLLLLSDLLSSLAFAVLYEISGSAPLSVLAAVALGVGQVGWMRLRNRPIDAMQWISLGLVLIFGLASLLTRNPGFIMVKPTLIYLAVGAGMLKRGWMNRYVPEKAEAMLRDVTEAFGYAWAGLMFLTAALNLAFAVWDQRAWGAFVAIFPIASKLALFAVQYGVSKRIAGRRSRAAFIAG